MQDLSAAVAANLTRIALGHTNQEYADANAQVLNGPQDVALSSKDLHPIFYGSADWHSCVHGYWLMGRLNRLYPGLPNQAAIVERLDEAFTPQNVATEMAFWKRPYNETFERPYGWVWLMKLATELKLYEDARGQKWAKAIEPMARDLASRLGLYLQRLSNPVRGGLHNNSAFTMALAGEYAEAFGDRALMDLMRRRAVQWYGLDVASTTLDYGGTDFLSPTIMTAEAMRRLLPAPAFKTWFGRFLPHLAKGEPKLVVEPGIVADRSDPSLAHLDGVNLSRAWGMYSLARALPGDPRGKVLADAAKAHLDASIDSIDGHYSGQHWLATYALLALESAPKKQDQEQT
jgi:hypothetical protein